MAKVSKTIVDKDLRDRIFKDAIYGDNDEVEWVKINDRQYGCLLTDLNDETRYIRLGAIVAELREDMTAEELMAMEIEAYQEKQRAKEERAQKRATKAEKDKAERKAKAEAEAQEKEG
jgi:DNA-directed RNA polymerase delta subunit